MALTGIWTDRGLTKVQEALGNQGWYVKPTRFEVAETAGTLDATRVGANAWQDSTAYALNDIVVPSTPNGFYYIAITGGTSSGSEPTWPTTIGNTVVDGGVTWRCEAATSGGLETTWFGAPISSRVEQPPNTIEVVLTIPPGADPGPTRDINEVYIYAEDQSAVEFLLVVAQPSTTIQYEADGTTRLRIALTIDNVNVTSLFQFNYTQATEVGEHNADPNAHEDIRSLVRTQLNLVANGDMAVDRNPSGFSLGTSGQYGFGPAQWAGALAGGTVSGTLERNEASILTGRRSLHFNNISLSGGSEQLLIRYRMRSDIARLFYNPAWASGTAYEVGDIVVPTNRITGGSPNFRFICVTAGTSAGAEPTWPTTLSDTVTDGTVVWKAIPGSLSFGFEAFQDTGATQFAVIVLRTPTSGENDFDGTTSDFYTAGGSDHPILHNIVNQIELEAVATPDVSNGIEVEITIATGVQSNVNFEFTRFKMELSQELTTFVPYPYELDHRFSNPYLNKLVYQHIVGTAAQVASGIATTTIDNLAGETFAAGDRVLVLDGTHTLSAPISLSTNQLTIIGQSPQAIIDLASTHTFTLSGTRCEMKVRFTNTTANSIVLSGAGSFYFGLDVALTAVQHSNGAMVVCTGTAGGIKRGSTAAPGDDTELVDKQYIDGLGLRAADIIVGSAGEVTAGDADVTISTLISQLNADSVPNDSVILLKDGTHTMDAAANVQADGLTFRVESQAAILAFSTFTLTVSGLRNKLLNLVLSGVGTGDVIVSGTQNLLMVTLLSPPLDPVSDSGSANITIWNENLIVSGSANLHDLAIQGNLARNVTVLTGATSSHNLGDELVVICNTDGDLTLNLPPASDGLLVYLVKNISLNVVTISPNGGDTIDGDTAHSLPDQYGTAELQSNGTAAWSLFGLSGGVGTGNVTQEDLIYHSLLDTLPFLQAYYDTFDARDTVDLGGGTAPTYNGPASGYTGVVGSLLSVLAADPEGVLPAGNTDPFYKFFVHAEADLIFPEIATVQCVADVADSLDGTYFVLYSADDETLYHVWYSTSGGSAPDPAPTGSTAIQVNITTGASASAVASATQSAIDALADFGASVVTDTVTITLQKNRPATDVADSSGAPTGFTFTVVYQGAQQHFSTDGKGIAAAIAKDNAVLTDETTEANEGTADDMTLLPVAPVAGEDGYYFGCATRFDVLRLIISTAGIGTWTITWKYWNGTAWVALAGVVDGTNGFTVAGAQEVTFPMPDNWEATTINSQGPFFFLFADLTGFTSLTTQPLGQQASTWTRFNLEDIIVVPEGFTSLHIEFEWFLAGDLLSFGVLFNESLVNYNPATRFAAVYTVPTSVTAPTEVVIPLGNTYTPGVASLQVYLNGTLLYEGVDWEPVDNKTVRLLVDLTTGQQILFTDFFGPVDVSVENQVRLNEEHAQDGSHRFNVATVTSTPYTVTDKDDTILVNAGADATVNLPTAVGRRGKTHNIKNLMSANTVTVDPNGSETIDGSTTKILTAQYENLTIRSDGANWFIM